MQSSGAGAPKSRWPLRLPGEAMRLFSKALMIAVLVLAVPGCSTVAPLKVHGSDRTARSEAVRRGRDAPPKEQGPELAGSREEPVIRGQNPGAGEEGGLQDAGSVSGVSPALSAPALPQPNPGVADFPSSSGSTLAGAAAGRPPANQAGQQLSGLNPIARNRLQREVAPGEEPQFNYPDIHADPAKLYHDRFGIDEKHDRFLFPWLMNLIFEDRWLLAERDPAIATQNQFRRRMKIDIRDPDPDTANFPNGAYTVPKGRMYIETSPVSFYGPSTISPPQYNWEYLLRYGLTDNLELRIFSNGLTATKGKGATTGVSPLAFDFKINFWEENTKYWIPAMGVEIYIQTNFGSPAFDSGTQPSTALLFDHTLPLGFSYEHNFGLTGNQGPFRLNIYQFSYQWSLQHQVVKDFDVFWHGFYNASALPRLRRFDVLEMIKTQTRNPIAVVTGAGGIWTVNDRLAIYGSYNVGLTQFSPTTLAFLGFAVAF